jgi:hypothetical protein
MVKKARQNRQEHRLFFDKLLISQPCEQEPLQKKNCQKNSIFLSSRISDSNAYASIDEQPCGPLREEKNAARQA